MNGPSMDHHQLKATMGSRHQIHPRLIQLLDLDIGWGHRLFGFDDQSDLIAGHLGGPVSCRWWLGHQGVVAELMMNTTQMTNQLKYDQLSMNHREYTLADDN